MHRVNYHLTDELLAELRKRRERTGIPVAELIRRALEDAYLKKPGKKRRR